ncbi:MAG: hypothetical protein KC420_09005 [Myxococcales bacterium]|nr:hypothetical protein [Myxococcales bacterium]MCB9569608.1 hypothetical protein [Myxococcales bacterium]MCB9706508.1 hypothetical protein [Myxococcales bacterium]
MHRRLALLLALASGCFVDPGAGSSGGGEASDASTGASASGASATTSSTSSSASNSSTSSTGPSTNDGDTATGTTGGASTGGGESSGQVSGDPSTGAMTTTGDGEPLLLSNTVGASCDNSPHCAYNGQTAPARISAFECFSAPIAPPFAVTRVEGELRALLGMPAPELRVYTLNPDTKTLGTLIAAVGFPPIADDTFISLTPPEPIAVDVADFCVAIIGGDEATTLVPAATLDGSAGPAFVEIVGPGSCSLPLTPLSSVLESPNARYCIAVEITPG